LLFLGLVLYLARASKVTKNTREKYYITGMGIMGLCFVAALSITGIAWLTGDFAASEQMPLAGAIAVLLLPLAFICGGLTMLLFPDAGASLFARRRKMKPLDKWIITSLPQRESFVSRGVASLCIGLFMFSIMFFFLIREY